MQQAPGGFAVRGRLVAFCLYLAPDCTADAEMRVPQSDIAGLVAGDVDFNLRWVRGRTQSEGGICDY